MSKISGGTFARLSNNPRGKRTFCAVASATTLAVAVGDVVELSADKEFGKSKTL